MLPVIKHYKELGTNVQMACGIHLQVSSCKSYKYTIPSIWKTNGIEHQLGDK